VWTAHTEIVTGCQKFNATNYTFLLKWWGLQCSSISEHHDYLDMQMYKIVTTISPCTTGNIQYCSTALGTKQTQQKLSVVLCSRLLISNEDFPHTCCLSICILISHNLRCCAQWSSMEYSVHHCDVTLSLKYISGYFHPL